MDKINVYLETGKKKVFATAYDWPGWARGGKDEQSALEALIQYAPRYAKIMKLAGIDFTPPASADALVVTDRLEGNSATDYGVPAVVHPADAGEVGAEEQQRLEAFLRGSLKALEKAAQAAQGKELRKGPRGGGRELDSILDHTLESNGGYLSTLGWKQEKTQPADRREQIQQNLEALLEGLRASIRGELPAKGPRGGQRWPARYFVRRVAWHVLDHVWEIEDRIT